MKKTLLLGSFAVLGLMANAQLITEPTAESLDAAGIVKDKTDVGVVVFADGEAGTIGTAYADSWGQTAPCGNYKNVMVGDVEVALSNGVVGNTNPTFLGYLAGGFDAGAVFDIVPSADGWVTIFTKMNPNKQYVVMEGKTGPMSYTLGYSNGSTTIHYTIPYDEDFYIDFAAPDIDKYILNGTEKPQFPWYTAGMEEKFEAQDTGFLTFNVLEGNHYYVGALGSKAAMGTFVLTEGDEIPTVTYLATDSQPEVTFVGEGGEGGDTGAVSALEVANDENAPVYNVLGQKVGADAKGILIQNGKKFIRR